MRWLRQFWGYWVRDDWLWAPTDPDQSNWRITSGLHIRPNLIGLVKAPRTICPSWLVSLSISPG